MYAKAIALQHFSKRLATCSALLFAVVALCYGIFLLLAVERTASLSKSQDAITSHSGVLSSLEGQYLALAESVTPERAQELGFVAPPASATVFANARPSALTLEVIK